MPKLKYKKYSMPSLQGMHGKNKKFDKII